MFRVTIRNLWAHKRRLLSTTISIVLGVAFMAGTFVLTDTLDEGFDDLFSTVNEGVDAEVRGPVLFESDFGGTQRGRFDESVVETVRGVDGVDNAAGYVFSFLGTVLDKEGDSLGGSGPPTILSNFNEDPDLNAFQLVEGDAPTGADEVVLDRAATEDGDYEIGDEVAILTPTRKPYRLVGVMAFGEADSAAGTVQAQFSLDEAQRIAGAEGQFDTVLARSDQIPPEELVPLVESAMPGDLEVVTGEQAAKEMADSVTEGFAFFQQILLVFGAIALLVATFIIYNTFSILVAQRSREMALLRAVGASRRQVLSSVLVEALVVGFAAAAVGLLVGVALGFGVLALLEGFGVELPSSGVVLRPFTIAMAFLVGVVVTTLAAVVPAIRATRILPIAALRDVAVDRSSRSWLRIAIGAVALVLAAILMVPALGDDPTTDDLPGVGLGAVLLILAVVVVGPIIARPLAGAIGWPLPRVKGATGKLARQNALRSPRRTASTAAALMIGVALVGFITIFAGSARASIESEVARGFTGDFVVQPTSQFSAGGAPVELSEQLAEIDGVAAVGSVRFSEARVQAGDDTEGGDEFIGAVDPDQYDQVFDVRMEEGALTDLTPDGIIIDRLTADDNDLAIGDPVTVTFPGGRSVDLTVEAISDDQTMLGAWTLEQSTFDAAAPESTDVLIAIGLSEGADAAAVRQSLEEVVDAYPTLEVADRDEWVGSLADSINALLNVIYGLLALSVIIAVIGIANTLSLSIHERTRELGLLRAVGMDRGQVRSSVRWEAVIVALLGTALGLVLAVIVSWVLVKGLRAYGLGTFELPVGSLGVVVLVAALLGVIAAVGPSRRAAKLNVLEAIATE